VSNIYITGSIAGSALGESLLNSNGISKKKGTKKKKKKLVLPNEEGLLEEHRVVGDTEVNNKSMNKVPHSIINTPLISLSPDASAKLKGPAFED
jgi:hypothetical protein